MYEDLNKDNSYEIDSKIMSVNITSEEIDNILDKHIDEERVSDEEALTIISYILQLFYRSGRRTSNTTDVHEKYNNLIADRKVKLMTDMGLVDHVYDTNIKEYVYQLTEKGKGLIGDL